MPNTTLEKTPLTDPPGKLGLGSIQIFVPLNLLPILPWYTTLPCIIKKIIM